MMKFMEMLSQGFSGMGRGFSKLHVFYEIHYDDVNVHVFYFFIFLLFYLSKLFNSISIFFL